MSSTPSPPPDWPRRSAPCASSALIASGSGAPQAPDLHVAKQTLRGDQTALEALSTTLRFVHAHRVPHALGVYGPKGSGKRALIEGFLAGLPKTALPFQLLSASPASTNHGASASHLPGRLLASLLCLPARLTAADARARLTSAMDLLDVSPPLEAAARQSFAHALSLSADAPPLPVLYQRLLGSLPSALRALCRSACLVLWVDGFDRLPDDDRAWLIALLSHLPQQPLLTILTADTAEHLQSAHWRAASIVFRALPIGTADAAASVSASASASASAPIDLTSAQAPSPAMLIAHLDDLSSEALHILRFAALMIEPFPLDDLLTLLRLSPLPDEQPWFDDPRPPWLQKHIADLLERTLLRRSASPPTLTTPTPALQSTVTATATAHTPDLRLTWELTSPDIAPFILNDMDPHLQRAAHACLSHILSLRHAPALTIAHHLHAAGQTKQAAALRIRAAQSASADRCYAVALDLQAQALHSLGPEDGPLYLSSLHDHGRLLLALGRAHDALPLFTQQLQAAFALQQRPASLRAYLNLCDSHRALGAHTAAADAATRCLDLCDRPDFSPDPLTAPTALSLLAAATAASGRPHSCSESLKRLKRALEALRALPPSLPLLDALLSLAQLRIARAELSDAASPLDEALALAATLSPNLHTPTSLDAPLRLRTLRCRLLNTYAHLLSLLGQHAPANARLQQATAIAKEDTHLPHERAALLSSIAQCSLDLGDHAHALHTLSRAHTLSTTHDPSARAALHCVVARAHALNDSPSDALKHLDRAQTLALKSRSLTSQAHVSLCRASFFSLYPALSPSTVNTRDLFLLAISTFEDAGHWLGTSQALSAYAAFLSSHNKPSDAQRCLTRALALAPDLKNPRIF